VKTETAFDKIKKSDCEVLLIYPPYFRLIGEFRSWYPLGLGYLASYLNSFDIPTIVYNADSELSHKEKIISYRDKFYKSREMFLDENKNKHLAYRELENVLKDIQPKVIGISVLTENVPVINDITCICRKYLPTVPIIIGGPHTLVSQNITEEICDWDFIIVGEAEDSLLKLVKLLLGLSNTSTMGEITGLVYKENGTIKINREIPVCKHFNDVPFPNLSDMYSFNVDLKSKLKKAMISTARGCPFKCAFCYMSLYYPHIRYRHVKKVIEEIKYNGHQYGIRKFYFVDDSFGANKNFLYELRESINRLPFDIEWSCMTHERLVDKDSLEIIKRAGCSSIHLGIESGSDKILKLLGKGTTVERIKGKCKLINEMGLELKAFFMVGIPFETEEDINKSMVLLRKIKPYEAILQIYVPYPNTKLYQYINENVCDIKDFYDWNHFCKAKINYQMMHSISPGRLDALIEDFFNLVEDINEKNHVYN